MTAEHEMQWVPFRLEQIAAVFAGAPFVWWLAGGHAIERFVGRTLRDHADIDVLVLRRDHLAVRLYLGSFDCWVADPPGRLRSWAVGQRLERGVHDVWCRTDAASPWQFQLMIDESEGETWVSRRDAHVRRPIGELGFGGADGIPTLAPEIQLYGKAKSPRPKDELDFAACVPLLSATRRAWLASAIAAVYGSSHPWLVKLR